MNWQTLKEILPILANGAFMAFTGVFLLVKVQQQFEKITEVMTKQTTLIDKMYDKIFDEEKEDDEK